MERQAPDVRGERDVMWMFDVALTIKGIDGILEAIGGVLVLLVSPSFIIRIAEFVTAGELATDPNDPVASTIRGLAHSFAVHTHYFVALYLVLHGLIKVLLVAGIFAGKKIAYPLFMIALIIFGAYEAYRGVARGELLLQVLAAFDLMLLILTAYEYERRYSKAENLAGQPTPRQDIGR